MPWLKLERGSGSSQEGLCLSGIKLEYWPCVVVRLHLEFEAGGSRVEGHPGANTKAGI